MLIQEPWIYGTREGHYATNRENFSAGPGIAHTTCIRIRSTIKAFPLLELSYRDITTLRLPFIRGGSIREITVTSAYLPYDSGESSPSRELWDVITHCCRNNLKLNVGCDARAHHTIWGSTGINPRRHHVMEYLVNTNLNILIKGNKHTFHVSNKQEVTAPTLRTDNIGVLVSNWHVSDKTSLSYQIYNLSGT